MTTKDEKEHNRELQQAMRQRYMDREISHAEYYTWLADFIGATFKQVPFLLEQIKASKDEHLNDLPLGVWDRQDPFVRRLAYAKGLAWSFGDTVCVLKTLARNEANNG